MTFLLFRPPFAFQHSTFVLALAFHRLEHHRQFVMGQQLKHVHRWNLVVSGPLSQEMWNLLFVFCGTQVTQWTYTDLKNQKKKKNGRALHWDCFCSSRNLTISICHSASIHVYQPVILCSTRLCRQLVEIRSQVQPFLMQCVCLVRLDPIERKIRMFFAR